MHCASTYFLSFFGFSINGCLLNAGLYVYLYVCVYICVGVCLSVCVMYMFSALL